MTTLETNTAPVEASGEGTRTPEKAVRWAIPLSLLACVLLAFFDKISIAALFSDTHFQQAMGIDFDTTRLGILMSAFLLSYGFSSVFLSGLGDKIAPLRLLTGMMAIWCVLMVAMGFTHNYTLMIVLRILLGVAEGPLFPLAFAIVRHNFPQHLQARATMLWLLGTPVGAAIGFPLSLWLLNTFGWQSTFFVMAMLTVPVLIFVRIGLRGIRLEAKPGTSQASRDERRAARRELFVSPHFWIICIFNIAFLTYLWGINGWLPGYLIKGKGIHLEHAGWLSSMPFIAMLAGEVIGAWLSDRVDKRAAACFISMAGAAVGLAAVMHLDTPLAIIAAMSFSTFMWGTGAPNIFALLAKATHPRVSATAGGIFNGLGNFAGALSPAVMGALIAFTHSMDSGLIFLAVMAAVGCVLLLPLLRRY
ncbi:MFS transporter [Enterobacter bugandensis]|uniref:MFS transporter n=1 Tax=Enterobacter TaxID=547 RepID=UPI0012B7A68E|nr:MULTISPECIES: MFS transporter [Enterobacter]MCC2001249.1 MFS transporter [Enterobacter bugandensis]MCE1391107.1 MFS transporter [Enterobacter bugandensis]MCK6734612.1 MFS transporter [Enterobacter bugandensis]MCK6877688.1 MFS transporter [Enterobacter bugandensis]MCK7067141.1 MFS transporter [Enterobacter bugandensis]